MFQVHLVHFDDNHAGQLAACNRQMRTCACLRVPARASACLHVPVRACECLHVRHNQGDQGHVWLIVRCIFLH